MAAGGFEFLELNWLLFALFAPFAAIPLFGSLFSVIKIQPPRADHSFLWRRDSPLLAIRITARASYGIICDDIKNEIFGTAIDDLMGFFRFEDEGIPRFNRSHSLLMPDNARPRDHMVKFPLRTMAMVRPVDLAWRYPANLDIEWVPLIKIHRLRFTP